MPTTSILVRSQAPADVNWRNIRRLWAAIAIGLFPWLFILDQSIEAELSPVLPGIIAIALLWAFAPYIHLEVLRRLPPDERILKHSARSKALLGLSFGWLLVWLVFA